MIFNRLTTLVYKAYVCLISTDTESSEKATENDAIFSLGLILFNALDYGLSEEEEISLRPELQHLISCMTNLSAGKTNIKQIILLNKYREILNLIIFSAKRRICYAINSDFF